MSKLIILPNKKKIPLGTIVYLNKDKDLKNSLCDILLFNNINIPHFCEKFGKCNTCKVFIKEGLNFINNLNYEEKETLIKYFIYNKNIRLSCQIYMKKDFNLIIKLF